MQELRSASPLWGRLPLTMVNLIRDFLPNTSLAGAALVMVSTSGTL